MELAEGTAVDRYVIEAQLGVGGMAVVYRARHITLGTQHAIKVLKVPMPQLRERLVAEGRAQAQLRHPNIVQVSDVIDVRGSPGLVMEFVQGPSLGELLQDRRLTLDQVDDLARGLMDAVGFAHRRGMVHRDLKPGNIMLAPRDGTLVPKITDFGLAKLLGGSALPDAHATSSGIAMGTPAYMAPEQYLDAKTVGPPADLFSLGAILYEMATGKRAFPASEMMKLFVDISAGDYLDPRSHNPELPERIAKALAAALTVDVSRRVPTAEALRALWDDAVEPIALPSTPSGPWDASILERAVDLGSGEGRSPAVQLAEASGPTYLPDPSLAEHETQSLPGVRSPTIIPEPPREPPARTWVLPAVLGGLGAAAVVLIGVWFVGRSTGPEAVQQPEPVPVPVAAPAMPPPAPPPPAEPLPEPEPQVAPAPEPPPPPQSAPAPRPAAEGTVTVEGDAEIELVRGSSRFGPGAVPAGTYRVFATFPGKPTAPSLTITVDAGSTVALRCKGSFGKCIEVR